MRVCMCERLCVCVGVKAGWERGAPVQGSHAAFLSALCSVPVSMATGAAAPFWALAWLSGAARLPVCPPVLLPSRGSCQLSPSRCPQALPAWAQESVFTNTIRTAPWVPWLCPEDVRPRGLGGGPGARLSAVEGKLSLAGGCPGLPAPRRGLPASRHSRRQAPGVKRPRQGPV